MTGKTVQFDADSESDEEGFNIGMDTAVLAWQDSLDQTSQRVTLYKYARNSLRSTLDDVATFNATYYKRHLNRAGRNRCFSSDRWSLCQLMMPVLQRIECSLWFQIVVTVVIALNTTMLCISVETMHTHDVASFASWDWFFVFFYTAEILLRFAVHQCDILWGPDAYWNALDIMLVIGAWTEQAGQLGQASAQSSGNMSYLRAMRLIKVAKVLRIFRIMRSFRQLRYILDSIAEALPTLLWTILLMSGTMLIFSLAFIQGSIGHDHGHWTSIGKSMLELLMAVTGGLDWETHYYTLWELGPGYGLAFILYVMFQLLVVFNAIQSTFVQRLLDHVTRDDYVEMAQRLKNKTEFIRKLVGVFRDMDTDKDGLVSLADLQEYMNDGRMLAFAHSLDMEEEDMDFCFSALTHGGKVSVDIDTFVSGCIKLRGAAKSLDMIDLNRELIKNSKLIKSMRTIQREFANHWKAKLDKVNLRLDAMAFKQEQVAVRLGPWMRHFDSKPRESSPRESSPPIDVLLPPHNEDDALTVISDETCL